MSNKYVISIFSSVKLSLLVNIIMNLTTSQ